MLHNAEQMDSEQLQEYRTIVDEADVDTYVLAADMTNAVLGDDYYVSIRIDRQRRDGGPAVLDGLVHLTISGAWGAEPRQLMPFWEVKRGLDEQRRTLENKHASEIARIISPALADDDYVPRHAKSEQD